MCGSFFPDHHVVSLAEVQATKRRKLQEQVDIILARNRSPTYDGTSSGANVTTTSSSLSQDDHHLLKPSEDRLARDSSIDAVVHDTVRRFWGLKQSTVPYNPSPNPISITRHELPRLLQKEYVVTEKSDGVRYLLVLCRDPSSHERIAVMMDRACHKYNLLSLPSSPLRHLDDGYFDGSIFDGELVWDDIRAQRTYLVFDVVAYYGREVRQCAYTERLAYIEACFGTGASRFENPSPMSSTVALSAWNTPGLVMRAKQAYPLAQVALLWSTITQQQALGHANDGLIFTPVAEPVGCRTHWSQFKWKPEHTLDLALRIAFIKNTGQWHAALFFGDDRNLDKDTVVNKLPQENACKGVQYGDALVKFDLVQNDMLRGIQQHLIDMGVFAFGCIVECAAHFAAAPSSASSSSNVITSLMCSIQRIRTDKNVPNNHFTVMQTLKNIEENIDMAELVSYISH